MKRSPELFIILVFGAVIVHGQDGDLVQKLSAECAAGNQEACKTLADIALKHPQYEIRLAAVEKLADQALLADIAKNDKAWQVREAAQKRLKELQAPVFHLP